MLFKEINSAEPVRAIDMDMTVVEVYVYICMECMHSLYMSLLEYMLNMILTYSFLLYYTTQEIDPIQPTPAATTGTSSADVPEEVEKEVVVDIRLIITEAVEQLAILFPDMFKTSSRCRPPHLNVDLLRDDLYTTEFVLRHQVNSSEELLMKLMEINKKLGVKYNGVGKSGSKSSAVEAKAKQYEFYLGLGDKSWIRHM